jgi:hypothetical protein
VNARISHDDITAEIGGVVCARASQLAIADSTLRYRLDVVSNEIKPGCGREGSVVTFLVGDRQAFQTAIWHAGSNTILDLVAGAPFALNSGEAQWKCPLPGRLVPFVGGVACGYDNPQDALTGPCPSGAVGSYSVAVYSAEQQAGCGVEGVEVAFKVLDAQGNVIAVAKEKGVWHVWDGTGGGQTLDLTLVPVDRTGIKLGNVGTGGSQASGTADWRDVSLVLGAIGLGGIAAGAALRRRAIR